MPRRQPAFFALLTDVDEERRLYAFARQPGRTIDQVHDWLVAECGMVDSEESPDHPRRVSRSAVGRWFKQFHETDRLSAATEMAEAIQAAATGEGASGTADIAGSVALQLAQRLQSLLVEADEGTLDIVSIRRAAQAVNHLGQAQQRVAELKKQEVEAMRVAEAAAKSGASATDVIAIINKALGLAA